MTVVFDTHGFIFHLLDPSQLGESAQAMVKQAKLFWIPTMVLLEIQYLQEIGRINVEMTEILSYIRRTERFQICHFDENALGCALELSSTRDPFDRTILGTAISRKVPIITRDRWMKDQYPQTVW